MKIKVNNIYRWKDTMVGERDKEKGRVYFIVLEVGERLITMKYLGEGSVIHHARSLFKDSNIILVSDGKDSKQPD